MEPGRQTVLQQELPTGLQPEPPTGLQPVRQTFHHQHVHLQLNQIVHLPDYPHRLQGLPHQIILQAEEHEAAADIVAGMEAVAVE